VLKNKDSQCCGFRGKPITIPDRAPFLEVCPFEEISALSILYPYKGILTCNLSLYGYNKFMTKASPSYKALPGIAIEQLRKLGQDIAIARKRRRMSMRDMAARMMVNLKTVQRMEKGDPTVGIGIMATALWILGMHRRLGDLVAPESDTTALQEDIKHLPRDFRKARKPPDNFDF
jgi:transcriptional regulator with XRE-family HTH domain